MSDSKAATTWKDVLSNSMPAPMATEIDIFETEMHLRRQSKLDEKIFAETRLRRGMYGQRYDNGQRHDGVKTQTIAFPNASLTKGPNTLWDAPGMCRIKIPMGKVSNAQLDVLADCADEYSESILHVTTRQDFQLHFIHIEDGPDLMRRLASVNITTKEACGNAVRNVTACPRSGVCNSESFDVTGYAGAMATFLMGHPDTADFGRKFKIAFSGCHDEPCALTNIHDLGAIARTRAENGKTVRGFDVYVGGGLGAVPHNAKLLKEFVREEELLPLSQAVSRVFGRLGEKKNRQRARIKFLIAKVGIEPFRALVEEELTKLPADPRWSAFLKELHKDDETPLRPPSETTTNATTPAFDAWRRTNVYPQRQPGYSLVIVKLPLGDLTSRQLRALGDLARTFTGDTIRLTVDQNMVVRWVSNGDLPEVHARLLELGLGEAGAETISDVTACPGTDTCKLGISASRGLAGELKKRLTVIENDLDPAVSALHVKASGCFNSCGQHHIADLGFLGVSRAVNGRRVPHFQLVLGGKWRENGASHGLAIGAVPSKQAPEVAIRLAKKFGAERNADETFQAFIQRLGKTQIRKILDDLIEVPAYDKDPSFYSDWGDPREYTIGDMGVGECAGEVVSHVEFGLTAAERECFEAQLALEAKDHDKAAALAFRSMLTAAKALVRVYNWDITDDTDTIVAEFLKNLHETGRFHDAYAGDKFVRYFLIAHKAPLANATFDQAHQRIEEATLFIEAAHGCYARISAGAATSTIAATQNTEPTAAE